MERTEPTRRRRGRHRASSRVRRRRAVVLAAAAAVVLAIVLVSVANTGGQEAAAPSVPPAKPPPPPPAVETGTLPWHLAAPVSREVVMPGTGAGVDVLGGLSASQTSLSQAFSLNIASGHEAVIGALAAGVHDSVGATVGTSYLVIGGGSPTTVADVQALGPPAQTASVVAKLPQPRSDAGVATIARTTYIVGGYDGSRADRDVLATTDGQHYSVVAQLPLGVRYPAVAALNGDLYVFGGQGVGGRDDGQALKAVQLVDVKDRDATVKWHLTEPLAGASAVVLGGHIYLAGGTASTSTTAGDGPPQAAIWAFDPAKGTSLLAGTLTTPVAHAGAAVVGTRAWLIGGESAGKPLAAVQMFTPSSAFGQAGAPGAGSPFHGNRLLIADRGNNRLLLIDDTNQILWTYPSPTAPAPAGGFYFPDDAFFVRQGSEIISNEEENEAIVILSFPSGKIVWSYGHPKVASDSPGYLHEPDDAYLLKNGQVTVADADNCRVLFINPDGSIANQIGTNLVCRHQPPKYVGSPNGDTPLADGNVLVSEINGSWVTEYTPAGQMVWTVKLPIAYPSDPQQIGPDLYLIADYSHPGGILEFNREGQILYRYGPSSGPGELNQPSLAELLPSGVLMTNDDYRDRMVAIDPSTGALVWQYGITDTPGTAPGMLNTPDGFDLLLPNGSTPTHAASG